MFTDHCIRKFHTKSHQKMYSNQNCKNENRCNIVVYDAVKHTHSRTKINLKVDITEL